MLLIERLEYIHGTKEERTMKKVYETPSVEVVKFQYGDQVVAQSGGCTITWINFVPQGGEDCSSPTEHRIAN